MIALPSQIAQQHTPQRVPVDTECVFPHAKTGDVRVYLMTDNPAKAATLGARLQGFGLPCVRQFIKPPRIEGAVVFNPWAPKVKGPDGNMMFRPIRFGDDMMILSSTDPEDVVRFAKWLTDKNAEARRHKPKKPASLTDLADAGEIETIEG